MKQNNDFTSFQALLLVEDDPLFRDLLSENLMAEGYAVFVAEDGAEAWRLLLESPPGLRWRLVTDLRLPAMDGIELIRRASETGRVFERIVIISFWLKDEKAHLSALLRDMDSAHSGTAGCVRFLEKPFGPKDLRRALRDA